MDNNWGEPERAPQVAGTTVIFPFVRACPNAFYCNDHRFFLLGRLLACLVSSCAWAFQISIIKLSKFSTKMDNQGQNEHIEHSIAWQREQRIESGVGESPDQSEQRLARQRIGTAEEASEQREQWQREQDRERQARRRAKETPEQRERRLTRRRQQDRECRARTRAEEIPEQREQRLAR